MNCADPGCPYNRYPAADKALLLQEAYADGNITRDRYLALIQRAPGAALPTTPAERKAMPIGTGVLDYFPAALAAVAHCSFVGNEQHNPGEPLHWARGKSTDEADALIRHFLERGTVDTDGVRHSAKMAWRALALLQKELEAADDARPAASK